MQTEIKISGGYFDDHMPGRLIRRQPNVLTPALSEPMENNPVWVKMREFCRSMGYSSGTVTEQNQDEEPIRAQLELL